GPKRKVSGQPPCRSKMLIAPPLLLSRRWLQQGRQISAVYFAFSFIQLPNLHAKARSNGRPRRRGLATATSKSIRGMALTAWLLKDQLIAKAKSELRKNYDPDKAISI